jgi:type IV secretory pathway VirJ component
MKQILGLLAVLFLWSATTYAVEEDTLRFGRFGNVHLYRTTPMPERVALFVSGDGGWNLGVVEMARTLAHENALVIGIDIIHYLKELATASDQCSYPAADFEALSQYVQKKLDLPTYHVPVLIGYSSGATLVYATLVQGPPNTFAGAISMGFCPDLPLTKPFCKGSGLEWTAGPKGKGYSFLPASHLEQPWIAFQGVVDQVCNANDVQMFVKKVSKGQLELLPKVGHGFAVQKNWLPQLRSAFERLTISADTSIAVPGSANLSDLPLIELPATGDAQNLLAVIISGDGGWANIDKKLGEYFSSQGISVVGLNSLKYFWTRRTPDGASMDLLRIISHYSNAWNKDKVLLVGYSRGADVLPFMTNRLPTQALSKVVGVALLGLEEAVDFQFHLTDWLSSDNPKSALPVRPEVEKLKGLRVVCFYGSEEKHSLCDDLDTNFVTSIQMSGGHHLGGDYVMIAKQILEHVRR